MRITLRFPRLALGGLVLSALLGWGPAAWGDFAPLPYSQGFESVLLNTNYWTLQGSWGMTTETAHGGTNSLTDSPQTTSISSSDSSAILGVDLRRAARPMLSFWHSYMLAPNADYGFVEISSDRGGTWSRWCAVTGLGGTNWQPAQLDLTGYAGMQVLVRFRLKTGAAGIYDGWYIDEVEVRDNELAAPYPFYDDMNSPGSATNWLASGWRQVLGSGPDSQGLSWRCAAGDWNIVLGGPTLYSTLTLAGTLDLTEAIDPRLSFWWQAAAGQNYTGLYADMSADGGRSWQTVWSWSSGCCWRSSAWSRVQLDVSQYAGLGRVALRFGAYQQDQDGGRLNVDFQVDEVVVEETPAPPAEFTAQVTPGPDPRHSARLDWTPASATNFACYAVYRATSPGVSVSSPLVAAISNLATLSFDDPGLDACGQTYYYRVIVWDTRGLHSAGADLAYRTSWGQAVTNFPWTDGFEGGDEFWALDRPWGFTSQESHSGVQSLTDSPAANYSETVDASATVRVYLQGLNRPCLSYWQRYGLEFNRDYGLVEVSANDGASWGRLAAVTGYDGTNWQQQRIDLTPYSGQMVLLRFRLKTDGAWADDGWYVDDIAIQDNGMRTGYPFADSMDDPGSATNWLAAGWSQAGGSAQSSAGGSWRTTVGDWNIGVTAGSLSHIMTLAGTLDLSGALQPQLSFWWRAPAGQNYTGLYAEMSPDGGKNWQTMWSWPPSCCWRSAAWDHVQIDASAFIGLREVALRFEAYQEDQGRFNLDFQIDGVILDEALATPDEFSASVVAGSDPRHSARLEWTAARPANFACYAIYRSTSPGLSIGSPLVATISNLTTLSFEDTGLDVCGQTYYYRVIVWDTRGLHSDGTDLSYRTSWGQTVTSFPWTEGFEGGEASWALDRPWGYTSAQSHSGVQSLTDSPAANFANGVDASATVRLSLRGLTRPCLSYWQLYSLEFNRDYGMVEVSSNDGASWGRIAAVTGYGGTNWQEQRIDLTPYSGQTVLLRFRLKTDSAWEDDGWYLDDIVIQDNGVLAGYPFSDPMDSEGSATNWLAAGWTQAGGGAQTNAGGSWRCTTGDWSVGMPGGGLSQILTLAGTLDFRGALNPQLSFWWRAPAGQNYTGLYAELSPDGGKNWQTVWSWPASCCWRSAEWSRVQASVSQFTGLSQVALRFEAYQEDQGHFNLNYQIDEVVVDETPAPPAEFSASAGPGADPRHSARLEWTRCVSADFGSYSIYRSTSPGVSVGSLLVTNITDVNVVAFEDPGLDVCGQTYYYRVIVWDQQGLHSTGSDLAYRTRWGQTVTNFPWTDGFESGDAYWALDRPWGFTGQQSRTGALSLTDSPWGNDGNNTDVSATLKVYLQGLDRPCLTYWQLYSLELNRDYGFVEVSANDGGSWGRVRALTGYGGAAWQQQQVDLTPWSGQTVLVRFRLKTDGAWEDDGWALDDLSIQDNRAVASYPFYDNMDGPGSPANWLTAGWAPVGGSPLTSAGGSMLCAVGDWNTGVPGGGLSQLLTLAGTLDFTAAVNPQLSFWWRAPAGQNYTGLYAEMSPDGGKNWQTMWSWGSSCCWRGADWSRVQVDASAFLGLPRVALRFEAWQQDQNRFNLDFQLDEVVVGEAPLDLPVTTAPGADARHNAIVRWRPSVAPTFASYAIYRSLEPGVTAADTLVAVIPDRSTLSYEDTGLALCGQTYYYRVLINYLDGWRSPGLADAPYRTSWGSKVRNLPFADRFESGDIYWALDRPWTVTTEDAHSGSHSLTDSSGAPYSSNLNRSATLLVDLRGAIRPALTFWHSYSLERNRDYALVEASGNDGVSWTPLAAFTGYSDWESRRLDLAAYAGMEALIRFRQKTDALNPDDGWHLDDVEIADNTAAAGYPFYDDMNGVRSRDAWLTASWNQAGGSAQDQPGQSWRCLLGEQGLPAGSNYFAGALFSSLTLAGTLDLSRATTPNLSFWWRAGQQWYHTLEAQLSPDGGKNWETVWLWNTLDSGPSDWMKAETNLMRYAGLSGVAMRFRAASPASTPVMLDFQIDEVLVGERDCPAVLTGSSLPEATVGATYGQVLRATNGAPPCTWTVVSNTLPPGMTLDPLTGQIGGVPGRSGTYAFWVRAADAGQCAAEKGFSLTVLDFPPPTALQTSQPFTVPGTNVVFCQLDNHAVRPLLSLTWTPSLPAGWSILGVSGDGQPELGLDGRILFQSQALTNPSLRFQYAVSIPAGQPQNALLGGVAGYLIQGMVNEAFVAAQPELLVVSPRVYHSADCNRNWVIETPEAARMLAFWRADAYRLDPWTCDGYAPGQGDRMGPLHSADYQAPYWHMDGAELNRVMAYWRAGCYQLDTNAPDGYSTGCATPGSLGRVIQQVPAIYQPGRALTITNTIEYSGALLSLLWRPLVPADWTVTAVSGGGSPEFRNGEIVWTDLYLPPSPVELVYTVEIPSTAQGLQQIRGEVQYFARGMITPDRRYADPDPASMNLYADGPFWFSAIHRLSDGSVELTLQGGPTGLVRVQASPELSGTNWTTLTNITGLNGAVQLLDATAIGVPQRFYRAVTP